MVRSTAARLANAVLTLVLVATALPVQHANAFQECQPMPHVAKFKTDGVPVDLDPLYPVWPHGPVWGPYPPSRAVDGGTEAGYDGRCFYIYGSYVSGVNPGGQPDFDNDGMGDEWEHAWAELGQILAPAYDTDQDGLLNVREFQWELIPVCVPAASITNCLDFDGDSWKDGAEVAYWNDPQNDALLHNAELALYDSDRLLDLDGDGHPNTKDADSDNDTLVDGVEVSVYGTYPEFSDSECPLTQTSCPKSTGTNYYDAKPNRPGAGDGISDGAELAAWNALGTSKWSTNFDGDVFPNNLLDPDSDNDGLLDGQEFTLSQGQVRPDVVDTDQDGLPDGDNDRMAGNEEVAWNEDTDLDGRVNANDVDSDNDGMPDGWEVSHRLNMVDPTDASVDRDGDGLSSLLEYQRGTDPNNIDTEGDRLLDGEEVLTYHTNPLFWDTDNDGMADYFEVRNGFNPVASTDATQDADADFFDVQNDGVPEKVVNNRDEYRMGRPSDYSEASSGPWLLGTNPHDPDSDKDGAWDGYEAYYGTDAMNPADVNADTDQDGLNWTMEVREGTDPGNPDTDGDGLCDGGRATNCHFPGLGSVANQPGEGDYLATPFLSDSDADGIPDGQEAVLWDVGASGQAQDLDGDLVNGIIDADSDNDGLNDGPERDVYHTDMRITDSDHDSLLDGAEVNDYQSSPTNNDTDRDGLLDGAEVQVHHTLPSRADTDGDGLGDGAELTSYGTDPLLSDTDQDQMPDGWEARLGTQPLTPDADVDLDADGLTNMREYVINSLPRNADSDGDGMPDGYEDLQSLGVTTPSASADADLDQLTNGEEYTQQTDPHRIDTDGDGLKDGEEVHWYLSNPIAPDTDGDGLTDGPEAAAWNAAGVSFGVDYDHDTLLGLNDADSDNDGLSDLDELVHTKTKPSASDSDGDGLSDFDEVVTYGGQFDPNDSDTDNDGKKDGLEASLMNPGGDTDKDGLNNGDEMNTYATDPTKPDTDCDGVQDGPERIYWGSNWNVGGNRMKMPDVDGDSIKDGVELGTVGTPSEALYRTNPASVDTDVDGLHDDQEAQNNVRVSCDQAQASQPALALPSAPITAPNGLVFMADPIGIYIRGGYGVRLYIRESTVEDFLVHQQAAGRNGKVTDPQLPDTDGDGLTDGQEVLVYHTDPGPGGCDTDHDKLGDGLEAGVYGATRNPDDACTTRDADGGATRTDPLVANSDGDGNSLLDGVEDANRNGIADGLPLGQQYCGVAGGETDPSDADSDDDGIPDGVEPLGTMSPTGTRTSPICFDTDLDGLSDGLEAGIQWYVEASGNFRGTNTGHTVLGISWPTWQPFQGFRNAAGPITTPADDPDADDDGVPDGLEDVNHNGRTRDWADSIGAPETDPNNSDSDGDNMVDGRELLIYSPSTGHTLGVRFPAIMQTPGFDLSKLVYSASNPWMLDPRGEDTDHDGAPDGADLNPRQDALLGIRIPGFQMLQKPDTDDWTVELFFDHIQVALPIADKPFDVQMSGAESVSVPAQYMGEVPQSLIYKLAMDGDNTDQSTSPSTLGTLWKVDQLQDDLRVLAFNIPETPPPNADLRDLSIAITFRAMDYDGCCNPDDRIDLDSARGASAAIAYIRLGEDAVGKLNPQGVQDGYLVEQQTTWAYKGNGDNYNDEAGSMVVKVGDTIPSFFLQGLEKITQNGKSGLPNGTCQGLPSCVH